MGRINLVIDDALIEEAMKVTGARTKREAVEIALRRMVDRSRVYRAIRKCRGKLPWVGDLAAWRASRG